MQPVAQPLTAFALFPLIQRIAQRTAVHRGRAQPQQPQFAQMEHHLRHAAGQEDLHRGWPVGPLGSTSTSRGVCRLTRIQSSRSGAAVLRRGQWRGCAAAGSCSRQRPRASPARCAAHPAVRMSATVTPRAWSAVSARADRRAMSSQMGWPDGASAECGNDSPSASATTCAGRRGAEELAAAAGRRAGAAAEVRRFLQGDHAVREARADRLHLAGVLARFGGSVTPPGTSTQGSVVHAGQRHHHGGQPLVARRHAEHSRARRQ
jgi:hypothetical protein